MALACQKALAETCKALKAVSFYPEKHPLREQLLHSAYRAIAPLIEERPLSLIVQRKGFSFADQPTPLENSPVTQSLAQELFIRQLQRLIFLPELTLKDFSGFLSLLAMAPQKGDADGGFAGLLKKAGVATVVVNEIDISSVFTRKMAGEVADDADAIIEATEVVEDDAGGDPLESPDISGSDEKEPTIEELLEAMSAERDDQKYQALARRLLIKGRGLHGDFDRLYPVLAAMAKQVAQDCASEPRRDSARMVLRQLGLGEMSEHLLDHLEDEAFPQKESIYAILGAMGGEVVEAIIPRLIAVDHKGARKQLMNVLVRVGTAAQPALVALLPDGRWQVVQTAVILLGEVGNREAVKELALTISHSDSRVRMASIRSLAKIGGLEATAVLTGLLQEGNQAAAIQAINWLGNTRNQGAVKPLLQLIKKWDLLGKSHLLKKEAAAALGRIGDRRALEPLSKLAKKRYLLGPARGEELKAVALEAIGKLGGEAAREPGQKRATGGERIGQSPSEEPVQQRNVAHE